MCTDGTVWAWGSGSFGKLGNGRASDSTTPVQVGGLTSVSAVAAGDEAAYALRSDGTVWAWGRGHYGALGNGAMLDSNVPVRVAGLTGVTAIASAGYTGYALKDGRIWSWGNNGSGQAGGLHVRPGDRQRRTCADHDAVGRHRHQRRPGQRVRAEVGRVGLVVGQQRTEPAR